MEQCSPFRQPGAAPASRGIVFDPAQSGSGELDFYRRCLAVPWSRCGGVLTVAVADLSPANLVRLTRRYGLGVNLQPVEKACVLRALEERFAGTLMDRATSGLERHYPEFSAHRRITAAQGAIALGLSAAVVAGCWAAPHSAGSALAVVSAFAYAANGLFRAVLVWSGADLRFRESAALSPDCGNDPPLYSILVPLYHEANVVPALAASLEALDYPPDRTEIVLVLEADDVQTAAAVEALPLDARFSVLRLPPAFPRTKPKAANYGLGFVRGEYVVIYDAEDRPEPDQLRKAVAAFAKAPAEVACLQARLNFYNAGENWLTRMFALDYALWFDFLLPGLDRFAIPMPLGGTSNHFRTEALRAIAGWDPYNVTEDADLGIRLARLGLRVATLDSTTYEEATVTLGNWIRQRSRWMKGYMQTWLVHMRRPDHLLRRAGLGGFLGFQLFVGGTFLTALLFPVLWALCIVNWLFGGSAQVEAALLPFSHASLLGLIVGNALFVYLAMLGPCRRGWFELSPYGFTAPLYWVLISAAGYRGLWQLLVKPWHWEKTRHGLSRHAVREGSAPG